MSNRAPGGFLTASFGPSSAYTGLDQTLGATAPGVWTLEEVAYYTANRTWPTYDPQFNNTTLLLHGGGTNGAQNNTFIDSSTNNFTITRNGNATQGTFTPFSQTGWSNNFNNANFTNIYAASSADFNFGSGNFTIECFFNPSNIPASGVLTFYRLFDTGQVTCFFYSGNIYLRNAAGNELVTVVAHGLSVNVWYHLAFVRSNTTYYIFRNGVQLTTGTGGTITNTNAPFLIGTNTAYNQPLSGFVSNFRVTNGQALYTTTFTPTTASLTTTSQGATASNVKLLTCQSNRFIDNSTQNTKTILFGDGGVNVGTRSVQAFSPFAPISAYDTSVVGGSGYFDGTGDYLSVPDNVAFTMGAGDFALEAWVYVTAASGSQVIFGTCNSAGSVSSISFVLQAQNGSGFPAVVVGYAGALYSATSSEALIKNQWNHIAGVRNGAIVSIYVNGVSKGTLNMGVLAITDSAEIVGIGRNGNFNGEYLTGYIASARIVKGSSVYTANFTPPTAPLTAITNTQLLTNFTNAGIVDSTSGNALETVGNAQVSTTQSKFIGGSILLNGTTDYLLAASNPAFAMQNGSFTVEAWIYMTGNNSTLRGIFTTRNSLSASYGFNLNVNASNKLLFEIGNNATVNSLAGATTLNLNTWYHVAGVLSGSTMIVYVNGVSDGTATRSVAAATLTTCVVGKYWIDANSQYYAGYISDLRITKSARYLGTFTPPTARFQDQ